ncbi:hypothetical protein IJG14_00185 [bacterium]|nr:hypothetical protein [bacterium]
MSYPTFDIDYQSAYSTKIEFKTQINEKHTGKEQRYPIWTYPKRTFTLKFDKQFFQREALEDFFMNVASSNGKFWFYWDKNKGGNDLTYLCQFDENSLNQYVLDYGFSQCELTFICIDNNPVQNVGNFNFWHSASCDFSISYNILSDKIFSYRYEKKNYWQNPKRKWTLHFQKNKAVRENIENFFIAKRGKFKSFLWTWDSDKGGDGNTYNVRFDNDSLNLAVDDYGFGEFSLDIVEVFPSQNPLSEIENDEIIPRKLLKIELDGGSIYILDNETLESLSYNNETYIGAPLSHKEIKYDDNSAVNKINIELSNIALSISGIIGNRGDVITNAFAVLTLVFLNVNTNQIINGMQKILYSGKCNNLSLDYEKASMDIESELGGYEKLAPIIKYRPTCQVRRFKDCRCGYNGNETSCDRTFTRCSQLGNTLNFRGFPSCVLETVIKV